MTKQQIRTSNRMLMIRTFASLCVVTAILAFPRKSEAGLGEWINEFREGFHERFDAESKHCTLNCFRDKQHADDYCECCSPTLTKQEQCHENAEDTYDGCIDDCDN